MKTFTGLTILFLLASGCNNPSAGKTAGSKTDTTFTITGKINIAKGLAILNYIADKEVHADSSVIENGQFSFKGRLQQPQEAGISFTNDNYNGGISFFAENANISIQADTASLGNPIIEGASSQKDLETFKKQLAGVNEKFRQLNKTGHTFFETGKLTRPVADSLAAAGRILDKEKELIIISFVKANPSSPVSAWAISKNLLFEPKVEVLEPLFAMLDTAGKSGIYGSIINESIAAAKATAIGRIAIGFVQPDVNGKNISLDSLRGKYVFVDFWASWCGPCRAENPIIAKIYSQYKAKGFDIIGVSLDTDRDAWIKAIKKDKLTWTEVSDLQGWKSETAIAYAIKGIPFNVLLDKKGVIIAKNLRGPALEQKLQEIFH